MEPRQKLRLELEAGDSVVVDGTTIITLEKKAGQRARFVASAPAGVIIIKMEGAPPDLGGVGCDAQPLGDIKTA